MEKPWRWLGHFWKVRFTTHPAGEGAGTGIAQGQGHLSRVGSLSGHLPSPQSLAPWEWGTLGVEHPGVQ